MCAGRRRSDARDPLESRIFGWHARPLCAVCAQSQQTEQEDRVETEKRLTPYVLVGQIPVNLWRITSCVCAVKGRSHFTVISLCTGMCAQDTVRERGAGQTDRVIVHTGVAHSARQTTESHRRRDLDTQRDMAKGRRPDHGCRRLGAGAVFGHGGRFATGETPRPTTSASEADEGDGIGGDGGTGVIFDLFPTPMEDL